MELLQDGDDSNYEWRSIKPFLVLFMHQQAQSVVVLEFVDLRKDKQEHETSKVFVDGFGGDVNLGEWIIDSNIF